MKQFKITILFTMLMSIIGVKTFAHDIEVANDDGVTIYYNFIDNRKELSVTYKGDIYYNPDYSGAVVIPNSINLYGGTYKVTSLGYAAFCGCSNLTSVTIPNSVTSIGDAALAGCSSLTSVIIPNSVTAIGGAAFEICPNLTSITIPNSVTSIGDGAFNRCTNLTSVEIPNSVTTISNRLFAGCSNLATVTIPNSVTSIGSEVFEDCLNLTSLAIPNSVISIGNKVFDGCLKLIEICIDKGNPNYCSISGVLFNKDMTTLVRYLEGKKDKSYTIPNSVTAVGDGAFRGCSSLTSVIIPNSVTAIGGSAFYGCSNLTSVSIPNSVTAIGDGAFRGCSSLTSVIIPNSVTAIGGSAFYGCSNLTSVSIPNSVNSIGTFAFSGCSNLTAITIPNSMTYLPHGAFFYCSSLTSVTIPNSVKQVGPLAFSYCSSLTSVTIPNSVTRIDDGAFDGCSSLNSVIVNWNTPPTITKYLFSNRANATLYVPAGSKAAYEAADYWKEFKEIVEIVPEKCATPTITIKDGLLDFNCETEGVTFKFSYRIGEANETSEGNQLKLAGRTIAHVSVCATKEGYLDSDAVTADVELQIGKKGDVNQDGIVSISDAVSIVNLILESGSE